MSFEKAFKYTIQFEGGYVNDPNDYGGETIGGISRVYWPRWSGWAVVDAAKTQPNFPKSLYTNEGLRQSVRDFYRTNFWNKVKGDDLDKRSEEVAAEAFDAAVNMGTSRAGRFIQVSLNIFNRNGASYSEIAEDGQIGPGTLLAYNSFMDKDNENLMIKGQLIQRGAFYGSRAKEDSSQERFIRGWLNRLTIDKV